MPPMLQSEEYQEPCCPMDLRVQSKVTIPVGRILEKTDAALNRNDPAEAGRILLYWLREADAAGDEKGICAIRNELMGLYRKQGQEAEALFCAAEALRLLDKLELGDSVSGAVIRLNAATVYDAFQHPEAALPLFEAARAVLEGELDCADPLLAGLYNNMGLCLCALGQYGEGQRLFRNALSVLDEAGENRGEAAITCLNLADALERSGAGAEIPHCMAQARAKLEAVTLRDGGYAFILQKCAPAFRHRGDGAYAALLEQRAEEIYARA